MIMKIALMLLVLVGVKYKQYYLDINVNLNYIFYIIYNYYVTNIIRNIMNICIINIDIIAKIGLWHLYI